MKNVKTLFFDLELCPQIIYCYGRWEVRFGEAQVKTPSYLINYSYRWEGEEAIHREAIWHAGKFDRNDEFSDKQIVTQLWLLLDEADVVVAHNAKKFDIKKANMFFLKHGLPSPSPYFVIDTLQVAKRNFGFDSNSLASLAIRMGCTYKKDSGGIEMMERAVSGDPDAQEHLEVYCDGDIQTMYEIYHVMYNWNNQHLNVSENCSCTRCGSGNLEKRGFVETQTGASKYQRYRCKDCGKWNKGSTIRLTAEERGVKLFPINN